MNGSSRRRGARLGAAAAVVALAALVLVPLPASAVPPTPPDGTYRGSLVGVTLARPVVGVAVTPGGDGYWLVASDGGIFSFGDAGFLGSTGAITLARPVVGIGVLRR